MKKYILLLLLLIPLVSRSQKEARITAFRTGVYNDSTESWTFQHWVELEDAPLKVVISAKIIMIDNQAADRYYLISTATIVEMVGITNMQWEAIDQDGVHCVVIISNFIKAQEVQIQAIYIEENKAYVWAFRTSTVREYNTIRQ